MKRISDQEFEVYCKNFTIKENDEGDTITISGWASTTDIDRGGDVMLEEAWTKGGLDNYLLNPIILAFHNPEKPIGEVVDYNTSNKGLFVSGEINSAAGETYKLIKAGILKAFSVGFRIRDAEYDADKDIFFIKDAELFELSVVSIPMNQNSLFSVKKSFDDEEDYVKFKKLYTKEGEPATNVAEPTSSVIKEEEKEMDKDKISLTPEELEAKMAEAVQKEVARLAAEKEAADKVKALAIEAGTTGAERLMKEFEERFVEKETTLNTALDGLRSDLQEKSEELEAMAKSKMSFKTDNKAEFTQEEVDTAVLTSKILGVGVDTTDYYKNLVTKAGDHLADMTTAADWENLFSTTLYQDIQEKTIIEPLFTNHVQMTSRTITFPWNPEAGYAEWIPDTAYKSSDGSSTGTGAEHKPTDNTIKAEKMATKEYLGYEEEEDAIIPLVPMIRDAIARRMVRSTDQELLLGTINATLNSGSGLINGLAWAATQLNSGNDYQYTQPGAFGDPITIADLQQTRRLMGTFGLMPGELIYVVSQTVMYDLLEDPDFRTTDLVGDRATILRGQIGSVNGSPVVVSDAFETYATGKIQACALTTRNHLFGTLRGLMVERDKNIEDQKHVLVSTRRFGLTEIIPAKTKAAYATAGVQSRIACANLVTA